MLYYLILLVTGLLGGFLAGLIGIGGGIIYVLVLPYLLMEMGLSDSEVVQYTIANSIVGTMFAGLSGNITHIKRGEFYWKPVLIAGLVGAVFSILALKFVVNTDWYQKEVFNPLIIVIAVFIIYRTLNQVFFKKKLLEEKEPRKGFWSFLGFLGGGISSLSGLGGGIIIIPMLNNALNMSMRKAKSISLGIIFFTSLAITVNNLLHESVSIIDYPRQGLIIIPMAVSLGIGVSIGSPIGVKISSNFSNRLISFIFVLFLIVVIIDKSKQLV
jgi:uncharacterized membrane protein YfcA